MNIIKSKVAGFTLIECLVALLILAIVLASSTRSIGMAIQDVHDNYVREAASWVAQNQYNQISLDGVFPQPGSTKQNVTMSGTKFIVTTTVVTTPNPYFRKVDISVTTQDNPTYAVYHTVSFFSQY
jgi:general secretion pathway protein I